MKEATLKGYGVALFDDGTTLNILYLSSIRYKYSVRYDTEGKSFYIVKQRKEILFRQIPSGLYFFNTSNRYVLLINTVLESSKVFYQIQYDSFNQARHALVMVGYPSDKDFKKYGACWNNIQLTHHPWWYQEC